MNRNPKHFIAFRGRDIKQAGRVRELGDGYELWDLRQFTLDEFVASLKEKIPPVNENVLNNYIAAEDSAQFGISENSFPRSSWGLLIPDCLDDALGSSFAESMFLLDLYSPHFLHPTFYASDFGCMKVPARTLLPVTAQFEDRSGSFTRPEFVRFFKMLLAQSQYGTWQPNRAQKWGREDWRLFVAGMLYMGLIEFDNQKDSFAWQRESADMATALEALFTAGDSRNEEVGYRLRKRLAALLVHRLPNIEKDTRDLYGARSGFVHGSFFIALAKESKLKDGGPPVPDFGLLYKQKENLRLALVAYLALAKAFRSDRARFGNADTVMAALDAAIIDTELRASLVATADEALSLLPALAGDLEKQ